MIGLRTLGVVSGFAAMAVMFAPLTVAAQLTADGEQGKAQAAPATAKEQREAARPQISVRPAAAAPAERMRVEPTNRPLVDPKDDPRSVEEAKGEPDATDR